MTDGRCRHFLRSIEDALARLPRDAIDPYIDLCWPEYRQLLARHGMDTNAAQIKAWGNGYQKRPLQIYRKCALKYTQYSSMIIYSLPDGSLSCVPIARKVEDNHDGYDSEHHYGT